MPRSYFSKGFTLLTALTCSVTCASAEPKPVTASIAADASHASQENIPASGIAGILALSVVAITTTRRRNARVSEPPAPRRG